MRQEELIQRQRDFLEVIEKSKNPEMAICICIDVIKRIISGEDPASITASYGIDWEKAE